MLEVLNKIDLLPSRSPRRACSAGNGRGKRAVAVSALTGEGVRDACWRRSRPMCRMTISA